jgi:hypothetical protein
MSPILWIVTIVLFILAGILWWTSRQTIIQDVWDIRLDSALALEETTERGPPITVRTIANIPAQMDINDSEPVLVRCVATRLPTAPPGVLRNIPLQFELQGAAFDVDIDRKVETRIHELTDAPDAHTQIEPIRWSISPRKPGQHQLALITSWRDGQGDWQKVDIRRHKVVVDTLLGLTYKQRRWGAGIIGGITLVLAVIQTIMSSR